MAAEREDGTRSVSSPRRDTVVLLVLAALFAFAILTLWVRESWALAAFQTGICATGVVWLLDNARRNQPVVWHPYLWLVASVPLLGLLQIAAGWTVYRWATWSSARNWAIHAVVVFLVLQSARSERLRARILDGFVCFTIALSIFSTLQMFTSSGRVFWAFDSGYADLVMGPFVSHNRYAQFIELALPIALCRALERPRQAALWMTGAAVMFASVVASASRSGFLLLLFEAWLVLLLARCRQILSTRATLLFAGQIAAVVLAWVLVMGWTPLGVRLFGMNPLRDDRLVTWQASWEMIKERPWVGFGLGAWPTVYPQFAVVDDGLAANQAHNDWLQWTAECGLPLLALMIGLVASILRPLLRSIWGVGFLVVMLHGLVDYPMQQAPAFASLILSLGGLIAAGKRGSVLRYAGETWRNGCECS